MNLVCWVMFHKLHIVHSYNLCLKKSAILICFMHLFCTWAKSKLRKTESMEYQTTFRSRDTNQGVVSITLVYGVRITKGNPFSSSTRSQLQDASTKAQFQLELSNTEVEALQCNDTSAQTTEGYQQYEYISSP